MVRVTGINKRTVLQGRPAAQAFDKIMKKRKNRPAAKSRNMKKARAARRAAADATAVLSSQGRSKGTAAGAAEVEVQQAIEPLQPARGVTEVSAVVSDTDQTAATNQTDPGTDLSEQEPNVDWLCLICTFMNGEASAYCTNGKCGRPAAVVDDEDPETVWDAMSVAQLADDTDHMTVATVSGATDTNRTTAATVQKATRTVRKSTPIDQMFHPIYDEYYKESDLTVDAEYATTTEKWQVAYINDRRQTPLGLQYHVLWVHPDRSCRKLNRHR
ncbi:hypothetical protein PHYSODRAFT_332390 [Phytophthora sojae]|uniref:RanBP2-type domain-containing protein n=1 Tax=Phytophthora sojae (strain P6497) TaxID=1094619 RepID=G4ZH21_PHYSP|nr:hypothetical protein PHYSODRAFT_332390 [Phytophthora sojae]EGZ18646.1 hypothetical protein PHYSODRAFT_332390 [Phytophthora sojae]|eukprot:XP_009527704.1 hypothetical protein PHYSODRAFT_332390 [Phytophthora sojae]